MRETNSVDALSCFCGGTYHSVVYRHTSDVGAYVVLDASQKALVCDTCKRPKISVTEWVAYERRAAIGALRFAANKTTGGMLRSGRKALGLKRPKMAKILGVTPKELVAIESAEKVPPVLRHAVLGLLSAAEYPDGVTVTEK